MTTDEYFHPEDGTQEQFEYETWWRDKEYEAWLDLLDEERMMMILNGEEDGDTES